MSRLAAGEPFLRIQTNRIADMHFIVGIHGNGCSGDEKIRRSITDVFQAPHLFVAYLNVQLEPLIPPVPPA